MPIAIIDYGAGNLRSVQKALYKIGYPSVITRDKAEIRGASGIILPGVGSFDDAARELRAANLEVVIDQAIATERPFLGICLGFQLLFTSSEEGTEKGLEILPGVVERFKLKELRVPHIGWNRLIIKRESPLLSQIESGTMMYFAHSYYAIPDDPLIVSALTDYGIEFASVISKGNLFGVQFHPEKSGEFGLQILKNFGKMCKT